MERRRSSPAPARASAAHRKTLAAEGVTVFATARNGELLASLTSEIEADGGTRPIVFEQDFVAKDGPQKIADAALAALGHVDILVNNAGGSRPMGIDAPEEHWVEGMTLNFDRHRQLTQKLLPNFLERRTGAIISLSGNLEPEVVNAAMVAKAGLVVWSKGLSEQLGQHGITVNCVQPGLIDTAQIRRLYPGEERAKFAEPRDRAARLRQAAGCGERGHVPGVAPRRYITGIVLLVDGGMRRYSFYRPWLRRTAAAATAHRRSVKITMHTTTAHRDASADSAAFHCGFARVFQPGRLTFELSLRWRPIRTNRHRRCATTKPWRAWPTMLASLRSGCVTCHL